MARNTSPTARAKKSTTTTDQTATEAATTEANEEAPVTDTAVAEATEQTAVAETATEAPAEKAAEPSLDEVLATFKASVETALKEKDTATGHLPDAQVETVKAEYQKLDSVKAKNAAKKHLSEELLRTAIAKTDIQTAAAVMQLVDNACVSAGAAKSTAEKAPADPAEAYIQRLVQLNLAYNLAVNDVPEGVDAEAARAKAQDEVGNLADQADKLYTWTKSTDEDKGEAPEVNPVVAKAVRLASGKVPGGKSGGNGGGTSGGPRGNIARHIRLVLKDQPVGTAMKVAEISNAKTEEYPDGSASPGAVSSRLKSGRAIEAIETTKLDGKLAARKTAEYEAA